MGSQPKEPELLEIPGAEGLSVDFFTNLMSQAAPTMDIPKLQVGAAQQIPGLQVGPAQQIPGLQVGPAQQIAGMTGIEKTIQGMLGKYLGTSATEGQAYKAGMGELQKTLGGEFYDPRTSDFWKGYRETSEMEQEKGVAGVRRRSQLGGGLYATPGQRTEAEYVKGMGAERTKMLGGLYERERDRRTAGIGQALGYAGFEEAGKESRLQLGSTIGALPRLIKGQEYRAEYTQQEKEDKAAYAKAMGKSKADYTQQEKRGQAAYEKAMGQSKADYTQQRLGNLSTFEQAMGQEQADYASSMAEIGIQSGAAQELMPQWYIDESKPADPLGGILGIFSSIIGK